MRHHQVHLLLTPAISFSQDHVPSDHDRLRLDDRNRWVWPTDRLTKLTSGLPAAYDSQPRAGRPGPCSRGSGRPAMLAMLAMLTHGFKDVWTNTWKFDDVWRMSIYDHICLLYVYYMSIMCIRILGNVKPVKLSDLRFSSNLPSVGFQESVPFHPGRSHPRGPWLAASSACSASNLHQRGSRWIQDAWSSMK